MTKVADTKSAVELVPTYKGEDLARFRITATTLGDMLLTACDRFPDKPAVIFPAARKTYAEVVAGAFKIARSLMAAGVQPRDHVGILIPTSTEFVETFYAVQLCGAVAVLLNARYRSSELAYVAENADLKILVTTDAIAEHVNFVERLNGAFPDLAGQKDPTRLSLESAPKLRQIVIYGSAAPSGFVTGASFLAAGKTVTERAVHEARVCVRLRDCSMILYTSGTSANPKGCLLTHEAMGRNAINLGRNRWRFGPQDKVWSPLPLFHIAALLALLSIVDAGGTFIGMEFFDPGVSLKLVRENHATAIFSPFVTFLQALLYHEDFQKTDFSQVRVMNSCFAAQPAAVGEAYRKAMPETLQVGTFGMTEASGIVSTGGWEMDPEMGFKRLGTPLVGIAVKVIDQATGAEVPVGERGEVLVRGYNLFEGYYRDPAKSAEALDKEGWYHTGDIGSVDAEGHVMFHGRLKDMLKVGGENVAAAEVEALLARHDAVKLAQVVGLPDPRLDEVPAAFVELKPGATATEEELIAFCRGEVASFKVPRAIRFVTEWPMSASKIQKFRLRQQLIEELGLA